jgi:hypothetical protein
MYSPADVYLPTHVKNFTALYFSNFGIESLK